MTKLETVLTIYITDIKLITTKEKELEMQKILAPYKNI